MLLFCSRSIYFSWDVVNGPLPTCPDPGGKTQVAPAYLQRLFLEELHKPLFRMSLGPKAEGGSLWRPKWNPQPDFETSKLEKSFWMIPYECYPLTIGKVFLPFKSSLWRKKSIYCSACALHMKVIYQKLLLMVQKSQGQPPDMHETLQIVG